MNKDFIERIREIIRYQNLSDRAFALKCGIKPQTLDMQMRGNRAVSLDTINAILTTLVDISAEWLLRGIGEMTKTPMENQGVDRIAILVDTIATLNSVISDKDAVIAQLNDQIRQLKK